MNDYIQVTTTAARKADAEKIAQTAIERDLAACVQIHGPVISTYRWQGKIEKAEEWICLIKTEKRLFSELEQAILAVHPYDTPEIIFYPITGGSRPYLDWVSEVVKKQPPT